MYIIYINLFAYRYNDAFCAVVSAILLCVIVFTLVLLCVRVCEVIIYIVKVSLDLPPVQVLCHLHECMWV